MAVRTFERIAGVWALDHPFNEISEPYMTLAQTFVVMSLDRLCILQTWGPICLPCMEGEERAWLAGGKRRLGWEAGIEAREVTGEEVSMLPVSGLELPAQHQ